MPELPDVETFRRYFDKTSLRQKINDVEVTHKKILEKITDHELADGLKGAEFLSSSRFGKYMFAKTDKKKVLAIHFGMTGSLQYLKEKEQTPGYACVIFHFNNGRSLVYINIRKIGRVTLIKSMEDFLNEKKLGPDAASLGEKEFMEILKRGGGTGIKAFLMDQQHICGIGNVYSDEIIYHARMHPKTPVNNLDAKHLKELYKNMMNVFKTAVEKNADPAKLPDKWLLPHRRANSKCLNCNGTIKKISLRGRSSYFCPVCQKEL